MDTLGRTRSSNKKAFDDIDPYIDLDFYKADNILEAQIHIYRVSPYPGIPGDIVGFALGSHEGALIPSQANDDLFQSVVWTDFPDDYSLYYSNNPFLEDENGYDFGSAQWQDAYTIIHEIGHALGLSHPQSDGEDDPHGGHHSSTKTVMSYNTDIKYSQWGMFGYVPSWTGEDIHHLQLIWGSENGNNDHPTNASDLLSGTDDNDSIYLLDGDDTFYAEKGDDVILGGDGEDFIYGGSGNDTLIGGSAAYKDELFGGKVMIFWVVVVGQITSMGKLIVMKFEQDMGKTLFLVVLGPMLSMVVAVQIPFCRKWMDQLMNFSS